LIINYYLLGDTWLDFETPSLLDVPSNGILSWVSRHPPVVRWIGTSFATDLCAVTSTIPQ